MPPGKLGALKPQIRYGAAVAARALGLLRNAEAEARAGLTILCYHRVLPEPARRGYYDPDLAVTPEMLEAHCHLLRNRFEVLPLHEAFQRWDEQAFGDRPLASITFDDGYRDNVQYALPVLRAAGLRATFFVVAGLVDTEDLPWYDAIGAAWQAGARPASEDWGALEAKAAVARAKELTPEARNALTRELCAQRPLSPQGDDLIMSSEDLRALHAAGHEIGSHSVNHPLLPQLDDVALRSELLDSRMRLERIIRDPVTGFCYPNGDHDQRIIEAARRAGYSYAVTMLEGVNRGHTEARRLCRWFVQQERLCHGGHFSPTLARVEWSGLASRIYLRSRR